jgi:hypothetical protein
MNLILLNYMITFSQTLLKISISLFLVAINSIIIHYIIEKLKFNDQSFDNPTTIALILGLFFFISTFFKFKLIIFFIALIIIFLSIKYFYEVNWKLVTKLFIFWLISSLIIYLILLILFFIFIY